MIQRRTLPDRVPSAMISSGKEHKRTPEIAASIVIGWETFLSFAQEVGALSREEAITLLEARSAISVPPLLRPDIKRARSRPPASSRCSAPRSAAVVLMLPVHAAAHQAMPIAGAGSW